MEDKNYSAEELSLERSFREWVQAPYDPERSAFWENWLREHPHKQTEVEQARQLVIMASSNTGLLPAAEKRELWTRIGQTLQQETPTRKLGTRYYWLGIAAAVTLLLVATTFWWIVYGRQTTVETAFGTIRQVRLPDGSAVVLNGNSRLLYAPVWSTDQPREVWLEGEAFFNITHQQTPGNARFLVHTGKMTIEVLGTQFNVSQRAGMSRVVLTSGRVKLSVPDQEVGLTLKPGEVAEYTDKARKLTQKVADPQMYTSWKNRELVFESTPLAEIAQILQDTYGLQVRFEQKNLQEQRISGTIPSDNIDMLLTALEKSSNLKIQRNDNDILIKNN